MTSDDMFHFLLNHECNQNLYFDVDGFDGQRLYLKKVLVSDIIKIKTLLITNGFRCSVRRMRNSSDGNSCTLWVTFFGDI